MTTTIATPTPKINLPAVSATAITTWRVLVGVYADLHARIILWRRRHPSRKALRAQLADARLEAYVLGLGFKVACNQADELQGALTCLATAVTPAGDDTSTEALSRAILTGTHPQRARAAAAILEAHRG